MKYTVIRKKADGVTNPFTEQVSKAVGASSYVESCELSESDAADLQADPNVETVFPSLPFKLVEPVEVSPRKAVSDAWGLKAVGATSCPYDGKGVTVAVLDTGIHEAHCTFKGISSWQLRDFSVNECGMPGGVDTHGHGTHVAGTIFGRAVDGKRIGVAPGVDRVLIGKVLGPGGGTTEGIYNALQWALSERADVICMSLGMDHPGLVQKFVDAKYPASVAASRALEAYRSTVRLFDQFSSLVDSLVKVGRGALLVAAAGNESLRALDPKFTVAAAPPSAADGFVSVGAIQPGGGPAAGYGVAPFSNTGCLVCAPGVDILSAAHASERGLCRMSGTSMATPHVVGVLALWTQRLFPSGDRPANWARDVQRTMESNVLAIAGLHRKDAGLGMVRAPQMD